MIQPPVIDIEFPHALLEVEALLIDYLVISTARPTHMEWVSDAVVNVCVAWAAVRYLTEKVIVTEEYYA